MAYPQTLRHHNIDTTSFFEFDGNDALAIQLDTASLETSGSGVSLADTISSNHVFSGTVSFTAAPTSSVAPSLASHLTTKSYVDGLVASGVTTDPAGDLEARVDGLAVKTSTSQNYTHTGTTDFDGAVTIDSLTSISWVTAPSAGAHLTNKTYVDNLTSLSISGDIERVANQLKLKTTLAQTYTFSVVPSTSVAPTNGNHLTNKTYVDNLTTIAAGGDLVRAGNELSVDTTLAQAYTFSTIPSCAVAPTLGNHLVNKTYVDDEIGAISLPLSNTIPPAADDGTGTAGVSTSAARGDHKHPVQTAAVTPVSPSGNLASTDVQAALQELQGDIDTLQSLGNADYIAGAGAPTAGDGVDGNYYLNVTNGDIYGPKATGTWPGTALGNAYDQLDLSSAIPPESSDQTGAVGVGTTAARADHKHPAQNATVTQVDTAAFSGNLSGTDSTVQTALETIDDLALVYETRTLSVSTTVLQIDGGNSADLSANRVLSFNQTQLLRGGANELDGDKIDIDVPMVNITPDTSPSQVNATTELGAIIRGIDNALGDPNGASLQTAQVVDATAITNREVDFGISVDLAQPYEIQVESVYLSDSDVTLSAAGVISWAPASELESRIAVGDTIRLRCYLS